MGQRVPRCSRHQAVIFDHRVAQTELVSLAVQDCGQLRKASLSSALNPTTSFDRL